MSSNRDGYVESKPMNAMSDVATINRFASSLVEKEAKRLGVTRPEAEKKLANRLGVSPGTLENIRRLRTKIVPNWLMNKVRIELIAVLQLEMLRLEHEISTARQTGLGNHDDAIIAAETQLAKARQALEGGVK